MPVESGRPSSSDVSSDYDLGPFAAGGADDDRGLKAIAGFRPLDGFAIEANYVDFGKTRVPLSLACITAPCPTEATIESQSLSVSAVGLLALLAASIGLVVFRTAQINADPTILFR